MTRVHGALPTSDEHGSHKLESPSRSAARQSDVSPTSVMELTPPSAPERKGPFEWTLLAYHSSREVLPRVDHYKNGNSGFRRPSIGDLHGTNASNDLHGIQNPAFERDDGEVTTASVTIPSPGSSPNVGDDDANHFHKLGWIQGVLIPCLLNIWGVMLFLRLSWVVAQAGIWQSLVIIGISAVVCVLTTLSMSAISTNGEVKGGGIYYIISRSLGPEFGASVGVVFAFANAVAASMNTIGFCNSLNDLLKESDLKIIDGADTDVRIVGTVAILVMIVICAVGMEWESKAQNILIVIIVAAIGVFIVGACMGPMGDDTAIAQGFVGLSAKAFSDNWGPDYRPSENSNQDFFTVFAIFFPSVTGIQAGANISGDLKDPAAAIPKGTLLSLLISMASYIAFVLFAGAAAVRDATGNTTDLIDIDGQLWPNSSSCRSFPGASECPYGLGNSYTAMQLISASKYVIYAGCFAATLSTALTNLLSVPRLIQALGMDKIYPGLLFFSKGYGKAGEPYRGYVLTFIVSFAFLLIAQLNAIAPLISNFYLASYALINFCTFHAALIKPLGWRPTFRYYNMWLSLVGFLMCLCIMFLIDWATSVITFVIIFALYLIVMYRKPDVNWGSSTQAQTYKAALATAYRLAHIGEHVKNYRPQVLVLTGPPQCRPALVELATLVTKNHALMLCGDLCVPRLTHRVRLEQQKEAVEFLRAKKSRAFYAHIDGMSFEDGIRALLQASGVGKMKPNVLMMGYKSDWTNCDTSELNSYFNVLHDAFDNRIAVAILRMPGGIESFVENGATTTPIALSRHRQQEPLPNTSPSIQTLAVHMLPAADSNLNIAELGRCNIPSTRSEASLSHLFPAESPAALKRVLAGSPMTILKNKKKTNDGNRDRKFVPAVNLWPSDKKKKGTIDVWWLYDDGGLTMLIPYIISTRTSWADCELRVFALANTKTDVQQEESNMASLLAKFRIDYTSLTMVHDIHEKPSDESIKYFDELLEGFREGENTEEVCVTDSELAALRDKTYRQLKLRELLQVNSQNASLVVMSLPMPRKGFMSAPLYMAWLEVITAGIKAPFLLIRGNHTSVLTFYS